MLSPQSPGTNGNNEFISVKGGQIVEERLHTLLMECEENLGDQECHGIAVIREKELGGFVTRDSCNLLILEMGV